MEVIDEGNVKVTCQRIFSQRVEAKGFSIKTRDHKRLKVCHGLKLRAEAGFLDEADPEDFRAIATLLVPPC